MAEKGSPSSIKRKPVQPPRPLVYVLEDNACSPSPILPHTFCIRLPRSVLDLRNGLEGHNVYNPRLPPALHIRAAANVVRSSGDDSQPGETTTFIVPMTMATSTEHATQLPSTSTFSFSAPFPLSASTSVSSAASPLKQRRVSLALPSSPRLFPAFNFRDDTGVGVHSAADSSSTASSEKKGKMRRIESDRPDEDILQLPGPSEKKMRKKWTTEETQMLVDGCNKVCAMYGTLPRRRLIWHTVSGASATGSQSSTTLSSSLMAALL